ncbi:uncharacterized protein LOC126834940 [Adelges cooleyi]|uniref:uncharacterized protein LOC126834940 n=1 Tax=Adelges cooleyi TaxID=133065 RepID=UPI00217F9401|nr:uncharacterized protein LOC126834940 [Adelges cooleyi]
MKINGYVRLLALGVCVACALHDVYAKATGSVTAVDSGPADALSRDRRFVVVNGEGVPEYPDVDDGDDDGGGYDYDGGYYPDLDHDLDDDDDLDLDDYDHDHGHRYWWYHYYHHHHHDGPTLPFPLFPPFRRHLHRHRRPVPGCDQWPFECRNRLEVIQWLQCYYEFVGGPHENVYHDTGHGTVVHTF